MQIKEWQKQILFSVYMVVLILGCYNQNISSIDKTTSTNGTELKANYSEVEILFPIQLSILFFFINDEILLSLIKKKKVKEQLIAKSSSVTFWVSSYLTDLTYSLIPVIIIPVHISLFNSLYSV